jgi:hypothetical protein
VVPSLDQRFAENKSLIDSISGQQLTTFTRVGNGTFVDSSGAIQTAGTNVARFTHDPVTLESLGLLVEEQCTNGIRNNTMVGAVAGTPGTLPTNWVDFPAGLTRQILGTGTINGVNYIDIRLSGTTNTTSLAIGFEASTQIVAATGQAWSQSLWLAVIGGSISGIDRLLINYVERSAVGGAVVQQNSTDLRSLISSAFARYLSSVTLTGGANTAFVQPRLLFGFASGASIDITLRIGLPQIEQSAVVTSVIPTSTTAVTRNASVADVINQAIASNIRTLYLEFRSPAVGTRGVVSLNDNTANERVNVLTSGADPRLVVVDGGVEQANVNGGAITANTRVRVAVRINGNDFAISINGAAVVTDTSGTLPTVDRLMLGRTQAGEYLNGTLARVTGWREALSNSTLQTLTG